MLLKTAFTLFFIIDLIQSTVPDFLPSVDVTDFMNS